MKNVAAVEIAGTRGEVTLSQIAGRIQVSHRGGEVTIEDAGSLDFNGRAGSLKLTGVRGDTSIKMDGGGEITAANLAGSLDLESRNTDVTLENLESTRGPIRVNSIAGSVTMKGLKSEARIDVRNAEVKVAMTGAAAVAIYAENDRVSLTPPPGGFNLDALVIDGEITPAERIGQLGLRATRENDKEARVVGAVKGGGPTITVRSTRGDLELPRRMASPAPKRRKPPPPKSSANALQRARPSAATPIGVPPWSPLRCVRSACKLRVFRLRGALRRELTLGIHRTTPQH